MWSEFLFLHAVWRAGKNTVRPRRRNDLPAAKASNNDNKGHARDRPVDLERSPLTAKSFSSRLPEVGVADEMPTPTSQSRTFCDLWHASSSALALSRWLFAERYSCRPRFIAIGFSSQLTD